jgi:hypothetical protein
MTRRERLENKVEKRREWAESRKDKAAALLARNEPFASDWAFITQPGHIPERARVIARQDRAFGHMKMAGHHASRAAGLESQLERTIFSDDENAIEALNAKIAELERQRELNNNINAIVRAKPKNELTPDKIARLVALGLGETLAAKCFEPDYGGRVGIPSYVNQNLGGNIGRLRDRLKTVALRQERQAAADAAPGGVTIDGADYVSVTFAEKPERSILDDLRAAGFHWSGGSWHGYRAKLPESVGA